MGTRNGQEEALVKGRQQESKNCVWVDHLTDFPK